MTSTAGDQASAVWISSTEGKADGMTTGSPHFGAVRRARAYEGIVEQIEEALRTGALRPGDRLPSEREMVAQFSVSRPTVREAMRVLESSGLVASRPGDPRGPLVTPYTSAELQKSMTRLANLDTISRLELLQFRVTMEGSACRLAAVHRTDEELVDMRSVAHRLQEIADGGEGSFGRAVMDYHAAIRRAARNKLIEVCGNVVAEVMGEVIDSRLLRDPGRKKRLQRSAGRAQLIIDAIAAHEGPVAAELARSSIVEYYVGDLNADERAQLAEYMSAS